MPKYADPSVYPVGTPAATDNVMTRTAAGADGNFALGNLAGMATVAVANDQAMAYTGGAWASYSLTAAGRALSGVAGTANTFPYFSAANVVTLAAVGAVGLSSLAAASQAAGRAAISAFGLNGDESASGIKTFTGINPIRGLSSSTGFWFESTAASYGFLANTDGNQFNIHVRNSGFGAQVIRALQISVDNTWVASGYRFVPSTDNNLTLGSAANRWQTVFAGNATINTSDARLKTDPRQLRDAEFKAASAIARLPAVWRWLNRVHGDENCEPEGREARKHFGPTVQAAIAVMEANGLDPFAYSFICYDEWEAEEATYDDDGNELTPAREAGDRYSFRKEELLCFIVRALAQEIDGLAERVAALEGKA